MPGERIVPQSEMIRAIFLEVVHEVGVPHLVVGELAVPDRLGVLQHLLHPAAAAALRQRTNGREKTTQAAP